VKNTYWARAPLPREQAVLFQTRIDDVISENHVVRVFSEILEGYDWSDWESRYHGVLGQPPIHPRVLASLWLFGIRRGFRSSRMVEYMASHNFDFMWLAEGHQPDYSTLSKFRTKFEEELKDLFRHVVHVSMVAGFVDMLEVAADGTRVKANSNRFDTWTDEKITTVLNELAAEFGVKLAESQQTDQVDAGLFGTGILSENSEGSQMLTPELQDLKQRQAALQEIQKQLREADKARRQDGTDPVKNPAQIPMTDPESRVLPNKEGGYAPNYNPVATTESVNGFIVDCDVVCTTPETAELLPSMDRISAEYGVTPQRGLGDGAYATGPNIVGMEARGIEFYSHLESPDPQTNPAVRADPTQPVPEAQWPNLPISPQTKKFDKACFQYDAEHDCYWCPMGKSVDYEEKKSDTHRGQKRQWNQYRCQACATCPLREKCVSAKSKAGRTVSRDVYTPDRDRLAAKMRVESNQKIYDQRMRIAETPFGLIKHVMGLRQFLLRGLDKVKTEWRWACLAVNLNKLARLFLKLRSELAIQAAN
jgi:transposase